MSSRVQRNRRGNKPRKPHPDFPLTANGNVNLGGNSNINFGGIAPIWLHNMATAV